MKISNYLLRFAVGVSAFIFGISVFGVGRYVQSVFRAKEQKIELTAPVKIEPFRRLEVSTFSQRNIEEAKAPVSEQKITKTEPEEKNFCQFDAGGNYYIIGNLPKKFKDFESLSIITRDYETNPEDVDGIPISPKGYVSASKEFKFTRINITKRKISFETQTKKGISYRFAGRFVDEPKVADEETDYPELVGRLTKMRDGKKIAEGKVNFGIGCGC